MTQERSTLIGTAKIFWRDFVPAWAFPVIFLYGSLAFERLGPPFLYFCLAAPLFFWSFNRASRPYSQKNARYWHVVFWGMVVPFIVWAFAVISRIIVS